jgi:Recombination endonuclease VII
MCSVQDCSKKVVAYGLCDTHRKRLSRHGHLNTTRPNDWGKREKHPLYNSWLWMKRMESKFSMCDKWGDFWLFVADMGDRPSKNHRLRRLDRYGNFSKSNCEWVEAKPNKIAAEKTKQWRKDNPAIEKNNYLQKMYGITLEDFNALHEKQLGCCAICRISTKQNQQSLSVDHCHKTGIVRGLLCRHCNFVIGYSNDSVERLNAIINYLSKFI